MPTHEQHENPYVGLRQQALTIAPDAMKLPHSPGVPFGILMETGYEQAVATLLSIADGSTSLYFSNGGGMIGGGQHANVAAASKALVEAANAFRGLMHPTATYPLPGFGEVRFYALTDTGVLTCGATDNDLKSKASSLWPLYSKAHDVITALRSVKAL